MQQFNQPLQGIFRDGIPQPVLRAFAPLYQALPSLQAKVQNSLNCYHWRANPMKCLDEDVDLTSAYMQASQTSFRLCPQQSATLLKCHLTQPTRAVFFCRDEQWQWRSCLMDQTGIRFWPYANLAANAPFSNGGQSQDFHLEDRHVYDNFNWLKRKASVMALRKRELEVARQRKHWLGEAKDDTSMGHPQPTVAPINLKPRPI